MKRVVAAAFCTALTITTAQAAPPSVYTWNGFYAGVNGGYGWGNSSKVDVSTGGNSASFDLGGDGGFFGGQVGWNFQNYSMWMWGIEADIQKMYATDHFHTTAFPVGGNFTDGRADMDWFGTLRARLGYAPGPILYYVTGGLAWGDPGQRVTIQNDSTATGTARNDSRFGWVVGAGLEWAVANGWTAKFEYQYLDFGSNSKTIDLVGGGGGTATIDFQSNVHTVRFGLNYHFATP